MPNQFKGLKTLLSLVILSILVIPVNCRSESPSKFTANDESLLLPQKSTHQSAFEFYASNPYSKLVMPVRVFGEVRNPGIYYVPSGTSLLDLVGMAGGPTPSAHLSDIQVIPADSKPKSEFSLYSASSQRPLNPQDSVVVNSSFKSELPLIFGGLSVTLSIATFILILSRK